MEATDVLVAGGDASLLVAFISADSHIRVAADRRHDGDTFADDCVELFFGTPEERIDRGVGLEINAAGVVSDFRIKQPEELDHSWDAGAGLKVAAVRADTLEQWSTALSGSGWIAEIEIPWAVLRQALALPGPDDCSPRRVRANFARWNHAAAGWGIFTIWSDPRLPEPKPHSPGRFGWLLLDR